MLDNVYAPPKADLSQAPAPVGGEAKFYVVSLRKFAILYIATFSVYQLYWCFKNWSLYRQQCRYDNSPDQNIWPVPRAIFPFLFIQSLFREVAAHAAANMRALDWNNRQHGSIMIFLLIGTTALDRLSDKDIWMPYSGILFLVGMVVTFFGFRKAQVQVNISCGDPKGESNARLTWANYIWLAIGVLIWILICVGLFLPDADA